MEIVVKGIPSNAGALNMGTEAGPRLLREAGLVEKLGIHHQVSDMGDVSLPHSLIRHDIAPVRNWPSPRIVWEETAKQLDQCFKPDTFTLIIGGGCSVFTGVFSKFHEIYGSSARVISVDHHIDIKEPSAEICMGATAYTHWFLTVENQWFSKPEGFSKEQMIALGYNADTIGDGYDVSGIHGYSKDEIARAGVEEVVEQCFSLVGRHDKILVHLDLDVIAERDLMSVYMPSPGGMDMRVVQNMVKRIVQDPRVVGLVVTELSGGRESSNEDALKVVDLIDHSLRMKKMVNWL